MEKPLDYIFIDTCVFKSESYFKKNGGVGRLFNLAEQGWIKILMPDIARREWLRHFKESTYLKFAEVEKKASIMGNTKNVDAFVETHKKLVADYDKLVERTFEEHLGRARVFLIPTSYVCDKLETVVDKYFAKQKPFGDKGKEKEFPDAFILASLEKYACENKIAKIQLFSTDKDLNQYNSELFDVQEIGLYLNDFINKRIPQYEDEEKRKRNEQDIARCYEYLKTKFDNHKKQIHDYIENFLSDASLYSERFDYADINEIEVEGLEFTENIKDVEILSVDDDTLQALCYVDVDAKIKVNHFCEEESVWDSEDKKYIFRQYKDTTLNISSLVKVTFEMDRTELDMSQEPNIKVTDIDTEDLEESIDDSSEDDDYYDTRYSARPANCSGISGISSPSAFQAMADATKKLSSVNVAISSISAMQASLQQMSNPKVLQGLQQMSRINPSIADTIKAMQKAQAAIPLSTLKSINDMLVKAKFGLNGKDKQ